MIFGSGTVGHLRCHRWDFLTGGVGRLGEDVVVGRWFGKS